MKAFRISRNILLSSILLFQACKQNEKTTQGNSAEKPKVDIFAEHVRSTAFQTPEQEQAGFKLPEGFEITLFASEPDIGKPINMEFDQKGRLWVTQSAEYPFAAPPLKGRDKITILEDTDGDGKADKFTQFAQDLNIPIGITPYKSGAIAYSIPNVYLFIDKDSDGVADERKKLLGPFGYRDTHGMVSNLIRGFDGWINSCHGFTNTSTVAGTDGDSISMTSGNTFRFRADGSRVEKTTSGRVNPFGQAYDEWGYLYSVDCHSKPIYQLIRGAEYPHFGKRAPAMGFAPEMMSYELGSTALSGLVYYTGEQYPEKYHHTFFNGDVVTCRINRNSITYDGSSPVSKREEDFLISADPWFRPVDLKVGPDGSIYVADFYNRIIGHYEVPLDHPGRDHKSGRIWKITYTGKGLRKPVIKDWTKLLLDSLVKSLNYPQLNIRMNIANLLVDKYAEKAVTPVTQMMQSPHADPLAFIQGLWILYRLNALPEEIINKAIKHTDPMVQVHGLRVLGEMKTVSAAHHKLALEALLNSNPNVQRVAVEVLARIPSMENMKPLLQVYEHADPKDTHLKYTALISIRDNLKDKLVLQQFGSRKWTEAELAVLMKTMPDVPSPLAASLTLGYLKNHVVDQQQMLTYLEYIARYINASQFDAAIALIQNKYAADPETQYNLYSKMRQGLAQKGAAVSPKMKQWGIELARHYLKTAGDENITWKNTPFPQTDLAEDPWAVRENFAISPHAGFKIMLSENNWYGPTGTLHSPSFILPASLTMNIFDNEIHNRDKKQGVSNNVVRIRLEKSRAIVAEYRASFDTVPSFEQLVVVKKFDLGNYKGEKGFIEIVDSSHSGSIGIGALDPALIPIPDKGSGQIAAQQIYAAEIASDYHAEILQPDLKTLLQTTWASQKARAAAAAALMTISPSGNSSLLLDIFSRVEEPSALREKIALDLDNSPSPAIYTAMVKALPGGTRNLRINIASVLSSTPQGIDYLLAALKSGDLPVDILSEIPVKEKLSTHIKPAQQQMLATLTKGKPGEEDRRALIQARIKNFDSSAVTVEAGRIIFMQNCSMCHQIKGTGGMIGPQLDAIGNWGQKALTEKILDPNRNISQAFRVFNITLNDGKQLSGLYRREEGALLIFANPGGQEFSIPKKDIKEKTPSKYTLMPDQFRNTIPEKDFNSLLKFLLSVK